MGPPGRQVKKVGSGVVVGSEMGARAVGSGVGGRVVGSGVVGGRVVGSGVAGGRVVGTGAVVGCWVGVRVVGAGVGETVVGSGVGKRVVGPGVGARVVGGRVVGARVVETEVVRPLIWAYSGIVGHLLLRLLALATSYRKAFKLLRRLNSGAVGLCSFIDPTLRLRACNKRNATTKLGGAEGLPSRKRLTLTFSNGFGCRSTPSLIC